MTGPSKRDPRKYFHLVTEEQWKEMCAAKMTWGDVQREYQPPAWCTFGDAIEPLGCWGLVGFFVNKQGEDYCRSCEFHSGAERRADRAEATDSTATTTDQEFMAVGQTETKEARAK